MGADDIAAKGQLGAIAGGGARQSQSRQRLTVALRSKAQTTYSLR
jgi:hypothetical protein